MKWRPLTEQERGMALGMGRPATRRFEQTILPHLGAAYNLARWLVRDPSLADDVVQDASLRALSYFDSYKGGDARAWLLQIVRNVAYTTLASRHRTKTASLDDATPNNDGQSTAMQIADPADDPEMSLSRGERASRLDQALAALPTELRECIVLHELEELSYKEVATITGVPIGTVMSRLWRARQALMRFQDAGGPA